MLQGNVSEMQFLHQYLIVPHGDPETLGLSVVALGNRFAPVKVRVFSFLIIAT